MAHWKNFKDLDWMQYLHGPMNLYINDAASPMLNLMTAYGDPLRPTIGHWRGGETAPIVAPWHDPTMGLGDQKIWFDLTNIITPDNGDHSSHPDSPESKTFVLPNRHAIYSEAHHAGETGPIPIRFRFLADKRVHIHSTRSVSSDSQWAAARTLFQVIAVTPLPTFLAVLNEAIHAGPMPHEHLGYVDKDGYGFTTEMRPKAGYESLHAWMVANNHISVGSDFGIPPYHTHLLATLGWPGPPQRTVINDKHENSDSLATMHSGLYSKLVEDEALELDNTMPGGHVYQEEISKGMGTHVTPTAVDPPGWHELDSVEETLFLELMQLHYNNTELARIVPWGGAPLALGQLRARWPTPNSSPPREHGSKSGSRRLR